MHAAAASPPTTGSDGIGRPGHPEPVGQHVSGTHRQARHRPSHALDVGHVHPAPVDLRGRDEHHVIGQRVPADQREQPLAFLLGELLGVVERGQALQPVRARARRPRPPAGPRTRRGRPRRHRPPGRARRGTGPTPGCAGQKTCGSPFGAAMSPATRSSPMAVCGLIAAHTTPTRRRPGDEPCLSDDIVYRHRPGRRVARAHSPRCVGGRVGAVRARVRRVGAVVAHHPQPAVGHLDRAELIAEARGRPWGRPSSWSGRDTARRAACRRP